ncbi:MAG: S41 family peptidase [Bacteroidales bacterium]|nr:S41 family peptidase [Bacteroidales bacterium]
MNLRMKTSHVALFISVAMVVGVLLGVWLSPSSKNESGVSASQIRIVDNNKLSNIVHLILTDYVDSITLEQIEDEAIYSLLSTLDPHSAYIVKEDFAEEKESINGLFEGIGIMFRLEKDSIYVLQVVEGGPSQKSGVLNGDRIVFINDTNVAGVEIKDTDVIKKLRGPKGTKVKIGVKREGVSKILDFNITRDVIPSHSISYRGMLDNEIGYIHLSKFSNTTKREMYNSIKYLQEKGMEKLILDLRGNGGGLLFQAIEVADMFLPKDQLIVYTEGRNSPRSENYSTSGGIFEKGALVVMIDESSASASEILAGAVQDNDRGTIVGRRSFGKGLVQEQFEMRDGSAIRLTIARYYTPSGRCIQRPYDKGTDEYYYDFLMRIMTEMESDSIIQEITDTTKYYTKDGRVVYGGGGIYPDVVLPYSRDSLIIYYNNVMQKGILYKYAFDFTERNRHTLLEKYPNSDSFVQNYSVSDYMFNEFINEAAEKGIKRDQASIKAYKEEMKIMLKSYMAELLYDTESFYKVSLLIDKDLQKTKDIIKKK